MSNNYSLEKLFGNLRNEMNKAMYAELPVENQPSTEIKEKSGAAEVALATEYDQVPIKPSEWQFIPLKTYIAVFDENNKFVISGHLTDCKDGQFLISKFAPRFKRVIQKIITLGTNYTICVKKELATDGILHVKNNTPWNVIVSNAPIIEKYTKDSVVGGATKRNKTTESNSRTELACNPENNIWPDPRTLTMNNMNIAASSLNNSIGYQPGQSGHQPGQQLNHPNTPGQQPGQQSQTNRQPMTSIIPDPTMSNAGQIEEFSKKILQFDYSQIKSQVENLEKIVQRQEEGLLKISSDMRAMDKNIKKLYRLLMEADLIEMT